MGSVLWHISRKYETKRFIGVEIKTCIDGFRFDVFSKLNRSYD